jgi:sensor histidine kinase YesM
MGYYFSVRSSIKEKLLRKTIEEKQKVEEARFQLEQHNDTLEKQQLQTEYAFLRSQINPHFLQNTLNFFYSKSLTCSEELSSAILTLSEIMRYSLNTKTNEPPPLLTEEVKQMNNVIAINQMRFGNRLQIQFNQTGELEGIRIIPLVLITLVENAFKHGELGNPDHPMTINLDISEYQESLQFSIFNLKKTGPKDRSHGIGLENIRRRLQLVYGDDASLNITDTPTTYTITLHIKKLHP